MNLKNAHNEMETNCATYKMSGYFDSNENTRTIRSDVSTRK
jgi:hypothetical protein